ncbi:hypothetical protein ACW2Q0_11925 [Nocardia sp. R16R-3T]
MRRNRHDARRRRAQLLIGLDLAFVRIPLARHRYGAAAERRASTPRTMLART